MSDFIGHLAKSSPLYRIFANGQVPLAGPHSVEAALGEEPEVARSGI